jgi:hypothetical protein
MALPSSDPSSPDLSIQAPDVTPQSSASTDTDTGNSFTLTPEQAESAGLNSLQVGDEFSVTITGTITANDPEQGLTADLNDATDGEKSDPSEEEDDEENEDEPKAKPEPGNKLGNSTVLSPKEAGFED